MKRHVSSILDGYRHFCFVVSLLFYRMLAGMPNKANAGSLPVMFDPE